jgi:hypothetical protein
MSKEIREGKTYSFNRIETTLENLKESEDEYINQLINGQISVDTYCDWLVGNGKQNDMS